MFVLAWMAAVSIGLAGATTASEPAASSGQARFTAAIENIEALERPGQIGLAGVWDGNKYVQCRLSPKGLLCEAAGARLQPTLARVLTPDRAARLAALGWRPDPSFGDYVQVFPAKAAPADVAARVLQTLAEGYGADLTSLDVETNWVGDDPCPPRSGPSQNLAGFINDAPAMAATAIDACAYLPEQEAEPATLPLEMLLATYGPRVTGEIQRLRVNADRQVRVILDTDNGYVQCQPETDPAAIYCEAVSADSWPAVVGVLTPDKIARLHALGYADPGRAPNYWKAYPLAANTDRAIATELLTILHDLYGYAGIPPIRFITEKPDPTETGGDD